MQSSFAGLIIRYHVVARAPVAARDVFPRNYRKTGYAACGEYAADLKVPRSGK